MHYFSLMSILEYPAKVTARKQTTIPSAVYKALKLTASDRIVFKLVGDGSVLVSRAEPANQEQIDPLVGAFLTFLEQEITKNPGQLQPLSNEFFRSIKSLTDGVKRDFDFDAALDPNDE